MDTHHEYKSSDDEDYNPDNDADEQEEAKLDAQEERNDKISDINESAHRRETEIRKQRVESAWSDLKSETTNTLKSKKKLKVKKKVKQKKVYEFKMPTLGIDPAKAERSLQKPASAEKTDLVKFAGQEVRVLKCNSGGRNTLDAMVAATNDPKSISTIEKSAFDWDQYKAKEGLNDELKQYTKDGYLEKQDFLMRVDAREFQNEKEERDKKRRKL